MIQTARQSERIAEAQARGLVLSYEQELEISTMAAHEAKTAYISEAQLLEQSEAVAEAPLTPFRTPFHPISNAI